MYDLVIVESPSKAKTIESYLGPKYKVTSTVGHVRDLATSGFGGFGIDIEDDFKPEYKYIRGKKKVVNEIVKLAKKADKIYIATDPDREGEAIGWHIADELFLDVNELNRIEFLEITKAGVMQGINNPKTLDMPLVKSQETRRIIDRIMGFSLSKLLQSKIKAKSAGRVQSVALQMIVVREREITAFIPQEYWKLFALASGLEIEWVKNNRKESKEVVDESLSLLNDEKTLLVQTITNRTSKQSPKAPYTTSKFQQDAANRLNYGAKRSMMTAQRLYEGIQIEGELQGLITYMRTDSTRLEANFIDKVFTHVKETYGSDYVGAYKAPKGSKNTQDAHEAIRPTNVDYTPERVAPYLEDEQLKVYTMIWSQAVASLMSDAKNSVKTYNLVSNHGVKFKVINSTSIFKGYKKVSPSKDKFNEEFDHEEGEYINVENFYSTQHFTTPKPRYTEAKLIKALEESGVGRPSTYASIIDTIKARNYVTNEEKKFIPTKTGELVTKTLEDYFDTQVNINYTSLMEENLDKIALDEIPYIPVIEEFYEQLTKDLDYAKEHLVKIEPEKTGNICPECDSPLVLRNGRYGEFEACSNFPTCRYITPTEREVISKCPKCKEGNIIEKKTKRGKAFFACDTYPSCDFAAWTKDELTKGDNVDETMLEVVTESEE